jgi:hypothetical protein
VSFVWIEWSGCGKSSSSIKDALLLFVFSAVTKTVFMVKLCRNDSVSTKYDL